MPSLGIILLIAGLFVAVGFIGGALVTMWFMDRNAKKDRKEDDQPSEPEERGPNYPKDAIILWRESKSGDLLMGIKQRIFSDAKMLSPKEKQVLTIFAKKWLQWLGEEYQSPAPVAPETIISNKTKKETQDRLDRFITTPIPEREMASQPVQSRYDAENIHNNRETEVNDSEKTVKQHLSIAGQINDVLQKMLVNSPLFGRGIQIMDDPREGVVVWIGAEKFLGIGEVTDPEVKAMIEKAVKAWEDQTKA
jgi:hypothetical protein